MEFAPRNGGEMKSKAVTDAAADATPAMANRARVFYVDWLRILAVLLLIPFHTTRIFDVWEDFYVKNAETSAALSYGIVGWLNFWHMPLLFLLAGAATWYALGSRGVGGYVKERIKRLLIPLLFGVLVIVPPQGYVGALFHGTFSGSWLDYLPYYFTPRHADTDYTGLIFTVGHLWFILFLFLIVLVVLPLLLWLKRETGRKAISTVAGWCDRRGVILLFFLPLWIANLLPSLGGKNWFYYAALFICGFGVMADERFPRALQRDYGRALALAVATMCILGGLKLAGFDPTPLSLPGMVLSLVSVFCTWCWLVALLGLGQRLLNENQPWLRYANEAVYPFYILHQTVIVLIGYWVVQWELPIIGKWLLIAVLALAGTLLLYDLIVRRNNVTRILFGMKPMAAISRPAVRRAAEPSG